MNSAHSDTKSVVYFRVKVCKFYYIPPYGYNNLICSYFLFIELWFQFIHVQLIFLSLELLKLFQKWKYCWRYYYYCHFTIMITLLPRSLLWCINSMMYRYIPSSGVILVLSEREKFCDNFRISGRSFGPNFGFPYTVYTFSLLPQLKIRRSQPA